MQLPSSRDVPGRGETRETRSDMMLPSTSVAFSFTMATSRMMQPFVGRETSFQLILPPVCLFFSSRTLAMSFWSSVLNCSASAGASFGNCVLM